MLICRRRARATRVGGSRPPLAGIVGAFVIASWSFGLIRDTGAILLDMNPDRRMADNLKRSIVDEGDQLVDLHLWRLAPVHLGAIVSVATAKQRLLPDCLLARTGENGIFRP
jgi:Co/Zn/Cd efflux system component